MFDVNDIIETLSEELPDSEVWQSHADPTEAFVVVDDSEVGQFYKTVREKGLEAEMKRTEQLGGWVSNE